MRIKMSVLDIFADNKIIQQEKIGKTLFLIYELKSNPRFKYMTLVCSEKGVKSGKNYGWNELEKAEKHIEQRKKEYNEREARKLQYKKEREEKAKEFADKLEIGTILVSNWGYEADWYDFYEVVDKKGSFAILRALKKIRTMENLSYGYDSRGIVTAEKGNYDGDALLRRKIKAGWIDINEYACASIWSGKPCEEACWH